MDHKLPQCENGERPNYADRTTLVINQQSFIFLYFATLCQTLCPTENQHHHLDIVSNREQWYVRAHTLLKTLLIVSPYRPGPHAQLLAQKVERTLEPNPSSTVFCHDLKGTCVLALGNIIILIYRCGCVPAICILTPQVMVKCAHRLSNSTCKGCLRIVKIKCVYLWLLSSEYFSFSTRLDFPEIWNLKIENFRMSEIFERAALQWFSPIIWRSKFFPESSRIPR